MPYSVQQNDLVITKRLPGTKVGDRLWLSNVREIGTRNHYLRGQPLVDKSYAKVEATVLEHCRSAKYTTFLPRRGRGPGNRKWRKISHRDLLTYLRISKISVGGDSGGVGESAT